MVPVNDGALHKSNKPPQISSHDNDAPTSTPTPNLPYDTLPHGPSNHDDASPDGGEAT